MRYWLLGRALVEAGHTVVMWSGDFQHVTKSPRQVPSAYVEEGIHVRLVPVQPYHRNVCWRRWRSHAGYAAEWGRRAVAAVELGEMGRPDCIVLAMPPTGLFDVADRLRCRWGCRVVVDIQDAWPETFYQVLPHGLRWTGAFLFGALRRVAQRAYCGADAVSAVAERYAELARVGGCRTKPEVFPLGTQLCVHSGHAKETPKGSEGVRLCYVGNLGETYDIATMLDGIRRLALEGIPLTLVVAGDGPQRERVSNAVAETPAVIRFAGYLAHDELNALLGECDVGVVPMVAASWVAVPNKFADYAAAGLAMINGLEGDAQTLMDRYQAGLFYHPGNVPSFMDAVRRYAADRELLEQHRQGAIRLAEECFDATKIYPAMAEWLENDVMKGLAAKKRD